MSNERRVNYNATVTFLTTMDMWLDLEALQRVLRMKGKSNLIRKLLGPNLKRIIDQLEPDERKSFDRVRDSLQLTNKLESMEIPNEQ